MERLEVAYVLTQMLSEVESLNNTTRHENDIVELRRTAAEIVSRHVGQYWWGCTGSGLTFQIVRNYTDKVFELIPTKKLQAFIDFVVDNKDSALIHNSMKVFPLELPQVYFLTEIHGYDG